LKILLNRKPVSGPWGGGNNFVSSFIKIAQSQGHEIVHNLQNDVDRVFVVDPRPEQDCPGIAEIINSGKYSNTPVIQRINECDARKNTEHMDGILLQCSSFINKTIFVSSWMSDYFLQKGWVCKNNIYLHNGVDKSTFKPNDKKDNKKISVVAHHWSNNLLKGFDAYEFLDYLAGKKLIKFTYIGRHRNSFKNTEIIDPCTGEKLASNLNCHDVYISGSRFDPGPNHILEAIACGLPTYAHSDGGGAVEFAGKDHSFSNLLELEKLVLSSKFSKNKYQPISWEKCIENYLKAIVS
jgi:glycosyltransferase involved in cell wall biosynthesis